MNESKIILTGDWKKTTFWSFFIGSKLPEGAVATTATGLIVYEDKLMLVQTHRGWELPGGHIEEGETINEALMRELHEEAGLTKASSVKMFGYNEIINPDTEKINKATGRPYPKRAYNPHFIIETDEKPIGCQDQSCTNSGLFAIDSAEVNGSKVRDIILVGYSCYLAQKSLNM